MGGVAFSLWWTSMHWSSTLMKLSCLMVVALALFSTFCISVRSSSGIADEFLELYTEVAKLSREGINVSKIVGELKEVHSAIQDNKTEGIELLLSSVRIEVEELKERASSIIFYKNVIKISTVIAIASIPVLLYIVLPRLYLHIWFRARRRWVVKSGSAR